MNTPDFYAELLHRTFSLRPRVGVVLGSGFAPLADRLEGKEVLPYRAMDGFPISTAPGHPGQFVAGTLQGAPVLCMQGRLHRYEGLSPQEIVLPIRVMKRFGVQTLILTNAAGAINPTYRAGEVMVLSDHINFMGINPLVGPNDSSFGLRFPDMSAVYSPALRRLAHTCAARLGLSLHEGVYLGCTGPSFETPAEIRAFRVLGADAVGMSTVPEAIAANHSGMEVLGLSFLSNLAAGMQARPLSGEDVNQTAARNEEMLSKLLAGIVVCASARQKEDLP